MEESRFSGRVLSLRDEILGGAKRPLWALLGAVSIILLLASANVANLFLVRAEGRRREVAVRRALGASRTKLVEQFVAEGVLLSLSAAVVGLGIAAISLPAIRRLAPSGFPRIETVVLDARSVGILVLFAVIVGVALGVFPAFQNRNTDASDLRDGDRGGSRGAGSRARTLLVTSQMALAVILLTSAGLMLRSAQALSNADPGFVPEDAVAISFGLPWWQYRGDASLAVQFYSDAQASIRDIPGVVAAGAINQLPMSGPAGCWVMFREGVADGETPPCVVTRFVTDGYLEAMGIRVLQGETITTAGMAAGVDQVVISEGLARTYFDGAAMGRGLITARSEPPYLHVTGIVADVHDQGLDQAAVGQVYYPVHVGEETAWDPMYNGTMVVRTTGRPALDVVSEVRGILNGLEPLVSIGEVRTLEQVIASSQVRQTFTMMLLVVAGIVAMILGSVGLYAVISYAVSQRRGEIGVRMALGAEGNTMISMVLRESLGIVLIGAAIGLGLSLFTSRMLQGLLFAVGIADLTTMIVVPTMLFAVAFLAALIPARRASNIDPAQSLRQA